MDDLTRIPLTTRLREGRSDGTDLRWTVQPIHVEAANRIAELETQFKMMVAAGEDQAGELMRMAERCIELEAERDGLRAALGRIIKPRFDFLEAFHLSARECREVARQALGAKP